MCGTDVTGFAVFPAPMIKAEWEKVLEAYVDLCKSIRLGPALFLECISI